MKANFSTASQLAANWRDDVLQGKPPKLYPVGPGELGKLEIGPSLVTLFGGAPGAGKSAFTMQLVLDALRATPHLKAAICNIEMSPQTLLDRQLARLSGIDLTLIRHRRLTAEHADRIDQGLNTLLALAERLAFIRPPFDLDNVAACADAFEADLIVLDYIQRISPPGKHNDKRGAVDATMNFIRQFADAGVAVIVVAAVSRSKDSKGRSSYGEGLNLASFRESSELEFGADDAFLLIPEEDADRVMLRHLKSRHGDPTDIPLRFHRRYQRFLPLGSSGETSPEKTRLQAALQAMWEKADPADEDEESPGEE